MDYFWNNIFTLLIPSPRNGGFKKIKKTWKDFTESAYGYYPNSMSSPLFKIRSFLQEKNVQMRENKLEKVAEYSRKLYS